MFLEVIFWWPRKQYKLVDVSGGIWLIYFTRVNLTKTSQKPHNNFTKPHKNLTKTSHGLTHRTKHTQKPHQNLTKTSRKPHTKPTETSRKPHKNITIAEATQKTTPNTGQKHGKILSSSRAFTWPSLAMSQGSPSLAMSRDRLELAMSQDGPTYPTLDFFEHGFS